MRFINCIGSWLVTSKHKVACGKYMFPFRACDEFYVYSLKTFKELMIEGQITQFPTVRVMSWWFIF